MNVPASRTEALSLDELVARLGRRPDVLGVVEIGSFATGGERPESDHDLVIVLEDASAAPRVGLTTVRGRLTDLLFVDAAEIDRIREADAPLDAASWTGRTAIWLRDGNLRHDPTGRLGEARARAREAGLLRPIGDREAYAAWFSINYNLAQTRRMLGSDDPLVRSAAEARMSWHGLSDLLGGYRTVRGLRWSGEKDALRGLEAEDPAYLADLRRFLAEPDAGARCVRYEDLAARAAAPLEPLWPPSFTALLPGDGDGTLDERLGACQTLWRELLA